MKRVACDKLFRLPNGDVDVCGTYAEQDEDGTVRCEAGHTYTPETRNRVN